MKRLLLLMLAIPLSLSAAIWEDKHSWSLQYEEEFSHWVESNKVHETLFTDKLSPYYGISTDCADTSYALRAIFSFEHQLPFAVKDPSGNRASGTYNNRSTKWDRLPIGEKRLIAMINELGESVGSENLAYFDSYPIAINTVNPGSLFLYKIKTKTGMFIRHSYNIKNINDVGTFDTIYSTQANKAQKGPLIRKKDFEFSHAPSSPWGFKRIRWPEHIGADISTIPAELGVSSSQYGLAKSISEKDFFATVKKTLARSNESSDAKLKRLFQSACKEVNARIDYVNQALRELKETNNKCMDYEKFDAFSTPSRDKSIREMFEKLEETYAEIKNNKSLNADPAIFNFSEIIFNQKLDVQNELLSTCPVEYAPGKTISLATFWKRVKNNQISSHPNDSVDIRWGDLSNSKTKCKAWY